MRTATPRDPPSHVAIFMDGNGRWAKARGLPRTEGHREGLKVAKRIVRAAKSMGVRNLTLYTFSTENWKRAQEEVKFLMGLVSTYLCAEFEFYKENGVRVVHSGDIAGLPRDVQDAIARVCADTAGFEGIRVNLAINYGGRDEILRAISRIPSGSGPCSEHDFRSFLDVPDMPDPDLIIRAGGELRLSNFLTWQSAYSELYFSDVLWPDWTETQLAEALNEYARRDRRFGDAR
ncbi:MAG: di-trans,poly-cis-decaprenylcistransferase [Spirochaetae bacterium HGW-Spirochaetae-7]|nr:MAG: di-trans,poly-cis-decaprenylcistransferase [Spirochaetae bacterium HGW-Spirochaetae-7]